VVRGRFAVVTTISPSQTERSAIHDFGAVLITAQPDGDLHRWLRAGRARAARRATRRHGAERERQPLPAVPNPSRTPRRRRLSPPHRAVVRSSRAAS